MTKQITWVSVKDSLPEKSGNYLVYTGRVDELEFSARHKAFNASDEQKQPKYSMNDVVTHWASLDGLRPEEEE